MNDESLELVPFHALNEFMRPDYRLHVVRTVLSALPTLPNDLRTPVDRQVKKHVRVQGFRSSDKAPARVKAAPTAEAFEDHPELVAAIIEAWAEVNAALRQQIYELLLDRGWHVLPIHARRSKLPGFFIRWPHSEEFELLQKEYNERFPESKTPLDDISLMVVWVGTRLPYQTVDEPTEEVTRLGKFDFSQKADDEEGETPSNE
jgi:hypothetical protein